MLTEVDSFYVHLPTKLTTFHGLFSHRSGEQFQQDCMTCKTISTSRSNLVFFGWYTEIGHGFGWEKHDQKNCTWTRWHFPSTPHRTRRSDGERNRLLERAVWCPASIQFEENGKQGSTFGGRNTEVFILRNRPMRTWNRLRMNSVNLFVGDEDILEPRPSSHRLSYNDRPTSTSDVSVSGTQRDPGSRATLIIAMTNELIKAVRQLLKTKRTRRTVDATWDIHRRFDETLDPYMLGRAAQVLWKYGFGLWSKIGYEPFNVFHILPRWFSRKSPTTWLQFWTLCWFRAITVPGCCF